MKKSDNIRPVGLKGNEKLNRMKELMGEAFNSDTSRRSVVELTKKGPDGNSYAIVRENHEYFIKISNKTENLVSEDFNYMGGLKNKKDASFHSYSKALKQLNLKFMSLQEAHDKNGKVNVFVNDNLLGEEMSPNRSFSEKQGWGDNDEFVTKAKGENLEADADEDKENSGDNVAKGKAEAEDETVKLSENEAAIDAMITGEEEEEEEIVESKKGYSISRAMKEMDSIVESVYEKDINKLNDILEGLSESERELMVSILKKKE
tara:strand:+ start:17687 stop:18472 length:786 start_codon:yes stop_codon:yes gene_type:complete